jgi:glycosyltransferase involved in cell wall biosynthesis
MNNNRPYVSVIMNCFNCEEFLEEAIDSVYSQTLSNWEIIFLDNASGDRSSEIANKYDSRLKYHRIDNNAPLGEARNIAMKKAIGKYIAFLDCDDLYFKEKLEKQIELMDNYNFVMSYGGAEIINKNGSIIRESPVINNSGNIFRNLLLKYEINMQSVMLLRSYILDNRLSFPVNFQYGPDYDLFMDIASRREIGVLHDIIVKTRVHSESLTHKKLHCVRDELKSTIDRLVANNPNIKEKFSNEIRLAYGKFEYYQVVFFISEGKDKQARDTLRGILTYRWEYFTLYIILALRLPRVIVMHLLNR